MPLFKHCVCEGGAGMYGRGSSICARHRTRLNCLHAISINVMESFFVTQCLVL